MTIEEAGQIKEKLEAYFGELIPSFDQWYRFELQRIPFEKGDHIVNGILAATQRGERRVEMPKLAELIKWL